MTAAAFLLATLCGQTAVTDEALSAERQSLRKLLDQGPALLELRVDATVDPLPYLPLHRWTNNERDPHGQGLLVLWHEQGRPVAAASLFPWNGKLIFELEATTRQRLSCQRQGVVVWHPDSGREFTPISQGPVPAETALLRLREMKTLADEFTVTMLGWRDDNADREQLRRLPKELFRYAPNSDAVDGAIFGFVLGTDPEALLLIEAVRHGEAVRYEYLFVRQTSGALEARRNDTIVWTAEKHVPRSNPEKPYFSLGVPLEVARREVESLNESPR